MNRLDVKRFASVVGDVLTEQSQAINIAACTKYILDNNHCMDQDYCGTGYIVKLDDHDNVVSRFRLHKYLKALVDQHTEGVLIRHKTYVDICNKIILRTQVKVQVFSGNDLYLIYRHGKVITCMSGKEAEKIRIFADNPEQVSVAVVAPSWAYQQNIYGLAGNILARALIWTTKDGSYIDKVHALNSPLDYYELMKEAIQDNLQPNNLAFCLRHKGIFPCMDTFKTVVYLTENDIVVTKLRPADCFFLEANNLYGDLNTICRICGRYCSHTEAKGSFAKGFVCNNCLSELQKRIEESSVLTEDRTAECV